MIWSATKYIFLVVFSSIVGANLGMGAGLVVGALTGESSWAAHGRCDGWTVFVLVAVVGAPLGFVYFCSEPANGKAKGRGESTPARIDRKPELEEPERVAGKWKSILVAPLIGGLMGLLLGGMAGGFLIALYFFVALSPWGPGGWWPLLPLTFRSGAGGFYTKEPLLMIPWLTIVAAFVVVGIVLGLFGTVTVGKKRFQVFRSNKG